MALPFTRADIEAESRKRFRHYKPHAKQLAFHNAGQECDERLFMAGNRVGKCVSYHTLIDLYDGTKRKAGELYEEGQVFEVNSWDGRGLTKATVTHAVKKPAEPLYRLNLSNGRWIECAANHRLLLASGAYVFVSTLLKSLRVPLASSLESFPSNQTLDGQHCTQTPLSCQDGCLRGFHQHDEQPQLVEDNGQASLPSQGGAQQPLSASCDVGVQASRYTYIRRLSSAHLSTLDDQRQNVAQCGEFSSHTSCSFAQCRTQKLLEPQPLSTAEDPLFQSDASILLNPYGYSFFDDNHIVSYNLVSSQPIYDFTVPMYKNYLTAGIIHHNTFCGATEGAMHLTGNYPSWWEGRRFNHPVDMWAASDTSETTRDILQNEYIGNPKKQTIGSIHPSLIIGSPTRRSGIPDAVDTVFVKHSSGGVSQLGFKSYDQGRAKFQGTHKHVIHPDEEPPLDVYDEMLLRTAGVGQKVKGMVMMTMTPLGGLTPLIQTFTEDMQDGVSRHGKMFIQAGWEDNPYLSQEERDRLARQFASRPHELEARRRGIPSIGSGMIYPVTEESIVCDPFAIPDSWRRVIGIDFGWTNPTAAVFLAHDPDTDIAYIYAEYSLSELTPQTHTSNLFRMGADWIPVVGDPSGQQADKGDGEKLVDKYEAAGLKIEMADNSVESGIQEVLERYQNGKLKIFSTCTGTLGERRQYARDEKGKVKKVNDHRMDAKRYAVVTGLAVAKVKPRFKQRINSPTSSMAI